MTLVLTEYVRKPFIVKAVKVTDENMNEVASWCGGTVKKSDTGQEGGMEGDVYYIKVEVKRPLDDRQTRAYVGDYVLAAGRSFKVYTDYAFKKSFVLHTPEESTDTPKSGRPSRPSRSPRSEKVVDKGPDLSPIEVDSRGVHSAGIHPDQMALVEIHDHGFPEEPEEMREKHVQITVNPGTTEAAAAAAAGLTFSEVRGVFGTYGN